VQTHAYLTSRIIAGYHCTHPHQASVGKDSHMSTTLQRLRGIALFALVGVIMLTLSAETTIPQAIAAVPAAKGVSPWTPKTDDSIYVTPKKMGSRADQRAFVDKLIRAIDATPKGATIRVSTHGTSDSTVVSHLIAAKNRGVHVKYTSWHKDYLRAGKTLLNRLKKVLGTNVKAKSYLKLCKGACNLSGSGAIHHSKVVLIDYVINDAGKRVRYLSFVGSSNLSTGSVTKSWNHNQLIVGHKKLYNALRSYVDAMKVDRTRRYSNKPIKDGPYALYLFPAVKAVNPAYELLRGVSCKAASGYGYKGRTVVRVMMFSWAKSMARVAEQLKYLEKKGCDVGVILTKDMTDSRIIKILKVARIRAYNSRGDNRFMHAKTVAISGTIKGKSRHVVVSGSLNLTYNGMLKSDEVVVATDGKSALKAALSFYNDVAKRSRRL